ncbi:unnamed protein product [Musa acuminata var. zebrina]
MSSAPTQRFHGSKGPYRYQKKFVPKNDNSSSSTSSSANPSSSNRSNPLRPLTTALRNHSAVAAARSGSREKLRDEGNFVTYLPHDEAVASGLGADAGGLDAVESQAVVDLLNDELSKILKMSPRDFWREVAKNDALIEFLDSYLQFRNRWSDFPHRGSRGVVAGVIVGELELCRRVFMILYRMSSNKDPGACRNDCLSMKDHTALLQEKNLLDLPKLLDICAIYGHDNEELTKSLVINGIRAQPNLLDKVEAVVSHFLNIVHTMHERCSSSLEVLISSQGHETHGSGHLHKDFLEVMDFINDAVVTLDAFADAYRPASFYLSLSFEMNYGNEDMLRTLARLHDSLLPSLQKGLAIVSSTIADGSSNSLLTETLISLRMLSTRIVKFGWKLLDFCYLNDKLIEDGFQTASKMFPARVEDPVIRGDILVQTFKEINQEISYKFSENHGNGTFLQKLETEFKILRRVDDLRSNGWLFMDEEQYRYISRIAAPTHIKSWESGSVIPISSLNEKVQMDEETVIAESKISQIKDLFPDYGRGFLSACLEVYNQNPEEVIQRILEGTLHEDLLSLDTSLEQVPSRKQTSSRSDKGKGLLLESAPQGTLPSTATGPSRQQKDDAGPPSSSLSSSYGRYTRKPNDEVPNSTILDSRTAKDAVRAAVLAAELEYEDEYDDSFDDLGLSIVESVTEETENLSDRIKSLSGIASGSDTGGSSNSSSKWSSQKKLQFYVKDGKNYSYKVSGSVAVYDAQEAALVNQAQKEMIHGLGRGGNLPVGAVKRLMDAEDQDQDHQMPDTAENAGRGNTNPQGRGGRRGGRHHHHRKDRAMKKHLSGVGGY